MNTILIPKKKNDLTYICYTLVQLHIKNLGKEMSDNISDIKSDLELAIKLKQELLNLVDNYFSIFKWLTNMSMALLGFYIALLLQLKFTGVDITTTYPIMVIGILIASTLLAYPIMLYMKG